MPHRLLYFALLLSTAGCSGLVSDLGGAPDEEPTDGPRRPEVPEVTRHIDEAPPSYTRRLSNQELRNAVRDLLDVDLSDVGLVPDSRDSVYDRVVQAQTVSQSHVEAYSDMADEIASQLIGEKITSIASSCESAQAGDRSEDRRGCAEDFLDAVAGRALRADLTTERRDSILRLYDQAASFGEGLNMVAHAIFRSPEFLYVIETGNDGGFLTSQEMAARLSFGICETLPDAELWEAALSGQLTDVDAVQREATRLSNLPCGERSMKRFFDQWLDVTEVVGVERSRDLFPNFSRDTPAAMIRETQNFVDYVIWNQDGTLADLFTANFSILDEESALLYGVEANLSGPTMLPPERRGVLTHPSVLSITSREIETAPIQRGLFVLERLLCAELPEPPEELEIVPPEIDDTLTTRERWEMHSSQPACAGCHSLIDPIGFALEDFDPLGQYRTLENDLPINAEGGVPALGLPPGTIDGGAQLSVAIADSDELAFCFARHWSRFSLAREESSEDVEAVESVARAIASGQSLRDAAAEIYTSDAFRSTRAQP